METTTTAQKNRTGKDVREIINGKIIEHLEQGVVPWRTVWAESGIPESLISKRPFRNINVLLLAALGYSRNLFITSKQLEKLNGSIRPSEKPYEVMFLNTKEQDSQNTGEGSEKKESKILSYYTVYNVSQCVGIPAELVTVVNPSVEPIETCEKIVSEMPHIPDIRNKETDVYYDPLQDYINIPKIKTFGSPASYYAALFHQLAHSTGHHTRLNRMGLVQMSEYGCDGHTLEELVAEIVTNYLENYAGIPCPFIPDNEYVNGWLRKFRSDRYLIFNACTLAQKAIDFLLNIQLEEKEAEE